MMKRILFLLFITCLAEAALAQPPRRRAQQEAATRKANSALTTRAQISFPTQQTMDEDVVWRRDIYREIDLTEDANAGLYYPVEPVGTQMNLFTYIFKLFMTGQINVYEYRLDGNEVFNAAARVGQKAFLDNYHIYYEKTDRGTHIDNSDIPSREVKAYYLKESAYYDQTSATFHTKVLALCPIMSREDDFGDAPTKYPLFWVRYDDLAPFLAKQTVMTSNLNNAAVMSIDDYFTRNLYRGKIYKTTNMLGKTLAQYCPNDSALSKEQKRIEKEIRQFETNIWGDPQVKDSLDSIAKLDKKSKKVSRKNRRSRGEKKVRRNRRQHISSSAGQAARVTVRRERH